MCVAHKPPSLWRLLPQPEQTVTVYFLIYIMTFSVILGRLEEYFEISKHMHIVLLYSSPALFRCPEILVLCDFNPLKCAAGPYNPEYGLYVFSDVLRCLKK